MTLGSLALELGESMWPILAVVLVVMALPGRRRDIDDDLPEEPAVPAQAVAGEGRRARRLRAQAEAEEAVPGEDFPPPPQEEPPAAVPQQPAYDEWDPASYAGAQYNGYDEQYQDAQQYQQGAYDQTYQADPYQSGQYDPYGYGNAPQGTYDQSAYDPSYQQQGYDPAYDPAQQQPHTPERPDGSQQ